MAQKYELEISASIPPDEGGEVKILSGKLQGSLFLEAAESIAASKFTLELARDMDDGGGTNYKLILYGVRDDGLREKLVTVVDREQ